MLFLSGLLKNPLYRFLLSAVTFYLVWYLVYDLWLHPIDVVDIWVVKETMSAARHILDMFGFATFSYSVRLIGIDGTSGLWMGDNCDSIELCAIFTGFIIAFPGWWKRKIWYIPLGWVLINTLNVLRITALAMIQKYATKNWLDFNHTYTFTILVYAFIFLLWYIWINKVTNAGKMLKKETNK